MLSESIAKLVQYGITTGLTPECERNYTINLLLDLFHQDDYEEPQEEYTNVDLESTLKELLDEVIDLEGKVQISQAIDFHKGVPTLEKGVYRNVSPMLKIRYGAFGKWINATHGDWLDTKEMESLWNEDEKDERLIGIVRDIKASKDYWEDHATGLFAPNRISIFAASDNGYEMICLIWFDGTEEPELWVYDCNGESRYKDLAAYLQAYIDDDVSASEVKWKLADM